MALIDNLKDVLGWKSAPMVGENVEHNNGYTDSNYAGADDIADRRWFNFQFGKAKSLPLTPYYQLPQPGDTLANRAYGTHTLIPGRPWSAQTRLKNMSWELPAYGWTINPDGAPYLLRTPGLPGVQMVTPTVNALTSQPEYLQPMVNLQIQNSLNWLQQFQAKILGLNPMEMAQQDMSTMFPSVLQNQMSSAGE